MASPLLIKKVSTSDSAFKQPSKTIVYSSNSGRCPGSNQPPGDYICAMLTLDVLELTHPTYSLITLGLFPADLMIVGEFNFFGISYGFLFKLFLFTHRFQ